MTEVLEPKVYSKEDIYQHIFSLGVAISWSFYKAPWKTDGDVRTQMEKYADINTATVFSFENLKAVRDGFNRLVLEYFEETLEEVPEDSSVRITFTARDFFIEAKFGWMPSPGMGGNPGYRYKDPIIL